MKTYTKTIDTETIKRNTNLIDLASRYAEMRKESSNEYSGACPKCGGDDRLLIRELRETGDSVSKSNPWLYSLGVSIEHH